MKIALETLLDWLLSRKLDRCVVGHRVEQGGIRYNSPHLGTPDLVAALIAARWME